MTTRAQAAHHTILALAGETTARAAWARWQAATDPDERERWSTIFSLCCERAR